MGIGVVSYRNISSNRTPIGYASSWKSSFDDVGLLNRDHCQLLLICYAKLCYVCFISLRSPSNFRGFLLDVLWGHFYNDRFLTNSSWHSSYLTESSRKQNKKNKKKPPYPRCVAVFSIWNSLCRSCWLGLWINDNLIRPFCLTIWKWVHWFFKQWAPGALDIDISTNILFDGREIIRFIIWTVKCWRNRDSSYTSQDRSNPSVCPSLSTHSLLYTVEQTVTDWKNLVARHFWEFYFIITANL